MLLVDDSAEIQQSFGALLATAPGVEIVGFADDLDTAVASMAATHPDLVVLDAKLRGNDRGIDVLRYVRQNCPDIQVLIFSQFPWASMRESYLEAGAIAYFDKGTEFQQARDFIAELSVAHSAMSSARKT